MHRNKIKGDIILLISKFNKLKEIFNKITNELIEEKDLYVKNPSKDFSRNRKMSLNKVIKYVVFLSGKSMYLDMVDLFNFGKDFITSKSAMIMQRDKIKAVFFKKLLKKTVNAVNELGKHKTYKGYDIYAVDGSDVNVCRNEKEETYVLKEQYKDDGTQFRGFNQEHLNAVYDVLNNVYTDVYLQAKPQYDERDALLKMLKDEDSLIKDADNAIFVCDRGYYSINMMVHFNKMNKKFLFRVKNNIALVNDLPQKEFNITMNLEFLSRKREKKYQDYKTMLINSNTTWDFADNGETMKVRIIRIKLKSDEYETLVTNVFDENLTIEDFSCIYRLRWGIETSFRELKYVIGILYTSSKKRENIQQEIYAKMALFNLCEGLLSLIEISKENYNVNHRQGIPLVINFLLNKRDTLDTIILIGENAIKDRPERTFISRTNKKKCFSSFMYRPAW